ncbi:MAG: hypothetical protein GF334_08425 [Candidatus Altiarchaeales archaeon]|nr:hypothetical protein [Candidatus Altiarchaeales archaeon]
MKLETSAKANAADKKPAKNVNLLYALSLASPFSLFAWVSVHAAATLDRSIKHRLPKKIAFSILVLLYPGRFFRPYCEVQLFPEIIRTVRIHHVTSSVYLWHTLRADLRRPIR